MSGISAVQNSNVMAVAANRKSAGSEETRESQAERVKEARKGEDAKKPAPPTATSGNNVNLLA